MTYAMHMRWPWERRQEEAKRDLDEVVRKLNAATQALYAEVDRLREERKEGGGQQGAGRTSPPRRAA